MRTTATMLAADEAHTTIRTEDVYDTDIADLWDACTSPERLARWIATVRGGLRVGGEFEVEFVSTWSGTGRIVVCDAPHHLLLAMNGYEEDPTEIEAWLSEEDGRTRLVVEDRGIPASEAHFHGAGWQAHLEDLARSLRGETSQWKARWEELVPTYEAMPRG